VFTPTDYCVHYRIWIVGDNTNNGRGLLLAATTPLAPPLPFLIT